MAFHSVNIDEIFAEAQAPRGIIESAFAHFGESDPENVRQSIGLSVVTRSRDVASDGFIYDDEGSHAGRWTNEMRDTMVAGLTRLFRLGLSIRAIARITGINRITVRFYRNKLRAFVKSCDCGEPATHQGWCRPRFLASELRQEFMRSWHPSKRWPLIPIDGLREAWGQATTSDAVDPVAAAPASSGATGDA